MRIIGGNNKGRVVRVPPGISLRPTTDLAKESLFNILNNMLDFNDLAILDLFAGTGNISLEFLSRNAYTVVAIDINPRCTDFIYKTSAQLGYTGLTVIKSEALHFLKHTKKCWDLIFADPPYDFPHLKEIHRLVFERKLLNPEGFLIIEHDKHIDLANEPGFFDHRRYGKVNFSFFSATE